MKLELFYLALAAMLTGLFWIPYVLDRIVVGGLMDAMAYPEHPKPLAPWAQRMKLAHTNAVENLVVFATLVLAADAMGIQSTTVAVAAMVYFWSRLVHGLAYTLKVPVIRTLAFFGGFIAQVMVAKLIVAQCLSMT